MRYRGADSGFLRYHHRHIRHGLRLHKCPRRNSDYRARDLLVDVDDFGHVGVVDHRRVIDDRSDIGIVVDVRDGGRRNHCVTAIDVVKIPPTDWIGGLIDLAWCQWKPADVGCGAASRLGPLRTPIANKHHQSRCIHGLLALRPWNPTPCAANVGPAAVMRNREAPGRVVYPSPAPGVNPGPMSVAVRSPARGYSSWGPDVAVVRVRTPGTVCIEVFIADHFR